MLVEVVRACMRTCGSCITYTVCTNYPFTYHNFELASFPGFPLLLSRESLARPMETCRDYWRPVETTRDQ